MRSLLPFLTVISFFQVGCNGFSSISGINSIVAAVPRPSTTVTPPSLSDANVMQLQVGCGYSNEPCVTVTVCTPGTSTCVSVPNVLVDTGSYGLRIFSSKLASLGLAATASPSGGSLVECVSYLDNSSDWGPITTVDVQLGSLKASSVRIQAITSTWPGIPSTCTNPDDSPTNVGFNGIIGVGLFTSDCGANCANSASNQTYYNCSGTSCTNIALPEAQQVSNPVAFLPSDNNGVALTLPNVGSAGASTASGFLVFGIGTRNNNTPVGATVLTADGNGEFRTTFNGQNYSGSFIDSGSNGLYFPGPSSLAICSSSTDVSGWYCPTSNFNFSATQIGNNGVSAGVQFQIGNAQTLLDSSNSVFNNVGAPNSGGFDWGFPFFLGRTVYVGLDSKSSSLASGTYWAY
jgi:hypothetical protein